MYFLLKNLIMNKAWSVVVFLVHIANVKILF